MVIFSAPSGAGKSTIINHLLGKFPQLQFSISATSRPPRGEEKDGVEYYFLTQEQFEKKIEENAFIEYEEVYPGRYYGTLKSEVAAIWERGGIALFDIDVKGGVNLKEIYGDKALSIFVVPPSLEVLKERLLNRGTEGEEAINVRLARAEEELTFKERFDITLVNDNLEEALKVATSIIEQISSP